MNANLLPPPSPIRIGTYVIDRDDIRRTMIAIVPIGLIAIVTVIGMAIRYEFALNAQSKAVTSFAAYRAIVKYPLDSVTVEPQIVRIERVHDALLSRRTGIARALSPIVATLNAFPTRSVRLISLQANPSGVSVTGDAISFEAARLARTSFRKSNYDATLDTTTHEESSSVWNWTGTINYPTATIKAMAPTDQPTATPHRIRRRQSAPVMGNSE